MNNQSKRIGRGLCSSLVLALLGAACSGSDATTLAEQTSPATEDDGAAIQLAASDETHARLQISTWQIEPAVDQPTRIVGFDANHELRAEWLSTQTADGDALELELIEPEAAQVLLASDGSIQGDVPEAVRRLTTALVSDLRQARSEEPATDPDELGSTQQPLVGAVLSKFQNDVVGFEKRIAATANLYPTGLLFLDSSTTNQNWTSGLRGRTLVVVLDAQSQPIWVSHIFEHPTRCSVPDWSCASNGRVTFMEVLPEPVGRLAASLDIYQADNANYVDLRNQFVTGISAAASVAQEIKNLVGLLYF